MDYMELLRAVPLWDESVWIPLQKKDFQGSMERLYALLGTYTKETIKRVFWKQIIEGNEKIRGEVTSDEWFREVTPEIARMIFLVGEQDLVEQIQTSLSTSPEILNYFEFLLVESIPGDNIEEKSEYLSKEKPWFRTFLLASPLNALTEGSLVPISSEIPRVKNRNVAERIGLLSDSLKGLFFSQNIVKEIFSIAEVRKINSEGVVNMSYFLGLTLLGFEEPEKLSEHIERYCNLPSAEAEVLAGELRRRIVDTYAEETESLKKSVESVIKEKEITVPIATAEETKEAPVKVNKIEFPKAIPEEPKTPTEPNAPFILFKGQDASPKADTGSSAFSKGFSLPFGFFKGRKPVAETPKVSVKIESGTSPAGPTGTPKIEKPSISVFGNVETRLNSQKNGIFGAVKEEIKKLPSSKTVHYSEYRTEVPPADPKPTVDGNVVSFK